MNYILTYSGAGVDEYLRPLINTMSTMKQQVILLVKQGENKWRSYSPNSEQETVVKSILTLLSGGHNVINWGNHIFSNDELFRLNKPSATKLAGNKAIARKVLRDNGIAIPKTVLYGEAGKLNFPIIARPPKHLKGKDFFVLNNQEEIQEFLGTHKEIKDWYFSEVFEKTHEFRVHVAHGKVLFIQQKSFKAGIVKVTMEVNSGHWEVLNWGQFNPKICQESIKAVEVLGLDYGAVDIMYNSANNTMAICEVNTDPDISTPYSLQKYGQYFSWCIRHNFPPHFELENGINIFYTDTLLS